MSAGLLDRADASDAFEKSGYCADGLLGLPAFLPLAQAPTSISSRPFAVGFGRNCRLAFDEIPPRWLRPAISQIASLGDLPRNWDSYDACPIAPQSALSAISFLILAVHIDMPLPSVVPTSGGGVQLEWHCNSIDLEIEFNPSSQVRGSFENIRTGESREELYARDLAPPIQLLQQLLSSK